MQSAAYDRYHCIPKSEIILYNWYILSVAHGTYQCITRSEIFCINGKYKMLYMAEY